MLVNWGRRPYVRVPLLPIVCTLVVMLFSSFTFAQRVYPFAIKTNITSPFSSTLQLGAEYRIKDRWAIELEGIRYLDWWGNDNHRTTFHKGWGGQLGVKRYLKNESLTMDNRFVTLFFFYSKRGGDEYKQRDSSYSNYYFLYDFRREEFGFRLLSGWISEAKGAGAEFYCGAGLKHQSTRSWNVGYEAGGDRVIHPRAKMNSAKWYGNRWQLSLHFGVKLGYYRRRRNS